MTDGHQAVRTSNWSLWRDVAISVVVLFLAYAAFDDITTDNDTSFTTEYVALAGCASWFVYLAYRRFKR